MWADFLHLFIFWPDLVLDQEKKKKENWTIGYKRWGAKLKMAKKWEQIVTETGCWLPIQNWFIAKLPVMRWHNTGLQSRGLFLCK